MKVYDKVGNNRNIEEDYNIYGRSLGAGVSGVVRLCSHKETGLFKMRERNEKRDRL